MAAVSGRAAFSFQWSVVKLWDLKASDALKTEDVGLVPWIPLMKHRRNPERILRECRDRIDRLAPPEERINFLAVTQVLAGLRYNEPGLFEILGGERTMIESPVLDRFAARIRRDAIFELLQDRHGTISDEIVARVKCIDGEDELKALLVSAARCATLPEFVARLDEIK